jgi:hypothetical protein
MSKTNLAADRIFLAVQQIEIVRKIQVGLQLGILAYVALRAPNHLAEERLKLKVVRRPYLSGGAPFLCFDHRRPAAN